MVLLVSLLFSILAAVESAEELVYVQVLFRHGARAPSERITDESFSEFFARGLGELTDRGFENSYLLGKFLKKRYVDSGFLDSRLKPKQMYFRSVNKDRCLSTASTVGAAMFEHPDNHLHVAVMTEETGENLLNYDLNNCAREAELVKEKCPHFTGNYHPWPMYEEFVANCLNYTHPLLEKYPFHTLEAHINEYKNGFPLPKLLAEKLDEIMKMYVKVTQWITGTGHHHDPRFMKIKFARIVRKLIKSQTKYWEQINDPLPEEKAIVLEQVSKFTAYSTQDWVLMGILDSFGVLEQTVGLDKYPEYNAMIILELWHRDQRPFVKMYYKPGETSDELIDVTSKIRRCPTDVDECPLKAFKSCCSKYTLSRREEPCASANATNDVTFFRRDKRFAGPE